MRANILWIAVALALAGCDALTGDSGGSSSTDTSELTGSGTVNSPWQIEVGKKYKGTIAVVSGSNPFQAFPVGDFFIGEAPDTAFYSVRLTGTNGDSDLAVYSFEDSDGDNVYLLIGVCDDGLTGDEICTSDTEIPAGLEVLFEIFNWGFTSSDYTFQVKKE